jgi:hypothetical protein
MKTTLLLAAALLAAGTGLQAQLSIPSTGVPVTENFTGFAGNGFGASATGGRLNASHWALTGFSDGAHVFGGIDTTGDFARGLTTGGVSSGGLYGLDNAGNIGLWIQPTGSDWNPGTLTLRLQNNTGGSVDQLDVAYDILVLNDQARAISLNFSFSTDDVTYSPVAALNYTSPEASDTAGVVSVARSTTLTGLGVPNGGFVYLRWSGADVSGGGSRDEYGLDNISVTASSGSTVSAFNFASTTVSAGEADGSVAVNIDLSDAADCSVDVQVADGTATNGSDYTAPALSTLTFTAAGPTSQSLNVSLNDDMLVEGDETFTLTLLNATGGCIIGASSAATVTIVDNDEAPLGECENLYFSEYVEGSSNNKVLEIYNPTSSSVDLSNYSVKSFNNGAIIPTNSLVLSGTLASGAVYIIANPSADSSVLAIADVTSTVTFYNGDDAVVLFQGGDTIDAIGQVGVDPGTNWAVDSGATSEFTLVRKPEVKAGQKNWTIGATEWLVFAQDDFSNLGSHTQDACAGGCDPSVLPTSQSSTNLSNRVQLNWTPTPGAVACQVQGKRLPTGPQPTQNVTTPPFNSTTVPYAAAGAGTTWTWRVRCACQVSPTIIASAFSPFGDTFSVPVAREVLSLDELALFPNPAVDRAVLTFSAEQETERLVSVSDLMGRRIYNTVIATTAGANSLELDVTGWDNGLYFIEVEGLPVQQLSVNR